MMISDIHRWEREKAAFHPVLDRAVRFLAETDWEQVPQGRLEIADGMYAMVQQVEMVPPEHRKSEHHKVWIDVQYLIHSPSYELIRVARQSDENIPAIDRLEENDAVLYEQVRDEFDLVLSPGMFAVFFPDDLHRPTCTFDGGGMVHKVVVKIHHSLFAEGRDSYE